MKCRISLIMMLLMFVMSEARVIDVPGKLAVTIQQGIDAAFTGDTVLVAEGRYFENIDFNGKAITLASHFLLNGSVYYIDNTIIDGSRPLDPKQASVVRFVSGEDTNSVLTGFTIMRGAGEYISFGEGDYAMSGGGILLVNAGARISHNHIVYNTVEGDTAGGAGISNVPWDNENWLILENNRISNNISKGKSQAWGAGVDFFCNAIIRNNEISENRCEAQTESAAGAGLSFYSRPDDRRKVIMEDNLIEGNICGFPDNSDPGKLVTCGAGVLCQFSNLTMNANVVRNNTLEGNHDPYGAGLTLWNVSDRTVIQGNEFYENSTRQGTGDGGAIRVHYGGPKIINNLIHHNSANRGGGVSFYHENFETPALLMNNTITHNKSDSYGSGIHVYMSHPVIINSIIWNPVDGVPDIFELKGKAHIRNSMVSDESRGSIRDQVFSFDPCFEERCFSLHETSPCVGLGVQRIQVHGRVYHAPQCDFNGCLRPCQIDRRGDLGAIESGHCCHPHPLVAALMHAALIPGEKVQNIAVVMSNQHEKDMEVAALFRELNGKRIHSALLKYSGKHGDDTYPDIDQLSSVTSGDEKNNHRYLYKGTLETPDMEDYFLLSVRVTNKEDGNTIIYRDNSFFTTTGPVMLDHFELDTDAHPDSGEQVNIRLYMKNAGKQQTVRDVEVLIESLDPERAVVRSTVPVSYGDIEAGEIAESKRGFYIRFTGSTGTFLPEFRIQVFSRGTLAWSETFSITGVELTSEKVPMVFELSQNYPNPFNPLTHITYQLPVLSEVDLRIYNLLGQEVATLVKKRQPAGYYTVTWNAMDLASGIYYYRLVAKGRNDIYTKTRKLTLLR